MKRRELIKLFEKNGWYLKGHGANHDKYTNGKDVEVLPRHNEINENLAKVVIKRRSLDRQPETEVTK